MCVRLYVRFHRKRFVSEWKDGRNCGKIKHCPHQSGLRMMWGFFPIQIERSRWCAIQPLVHFVECTFAFALLLLIFYLNTFTQYYFVFSSTISFLTCDSWRSVYTDFDSKPKCEKEEKCDFISLPSKNRPSVSANGPWWNFNRSDLIGVFCCQEQHFIMV